MREWRSRLLLIAAAIVPFVPAALQFMARGIPDYLFTGDGATLELRMLHAARGEQLLGPYSRFNWSHPGPTFFYLALPLYEMFQERGPALNLFMFGVNMAGAVTIVLIARKLKGDAFAWLTAGLLAVFELIALPFVQTGEWNPVSPILPLVLLSLLTARLSLGGMTTLPAFVLIASTVVQTHVGFVPEVAALAVVAMTANVWRIWGGGGGRFSMSRRSWWIAGSTAAVLGACWTLPVYESATTRPGNFSRLFEFFSTSHVAEHGWDVVFPAVFEQLSAVPVALLQALRIPATTPGPLLGEAITIAMCGMLVAAAVRAARRADATLGVLAAIGLAQIAAAIFAVRSIRGELLPYLVFWVTVPGLMTLLVAAAWASAATGARRVAGIAGGIALLTLTLTAPITRAPAFRDEDAAATRLAHQVADYIAASKLEPPIVRMASGDAWPTLSAVVLYLRKKEIPFYVDPSWTFMFGKPLQDPGGEHPVLLVGDTQFDERARRQPGVERVASEGNVYVYFQEAGYLGRRRITPPPELASVSGVEREPHIIVDGAIPTEGTSWDSAGSAILTSTASTVTIRVPRQGVVGMFASVDGNDLYTVHCGSRQVSWPLGVSPPEQGVIGMQTRWLFASDVGTCDTVTLMPVSGDGFYSVAEVGFLHR